jgi:N-acetylglucosaminyl-diphospho-decaprenol L-rhamnosyltransferase
MHELAVYVPNLNGGERLLDTLDSLARQTVPATIVLIDNGSTDDSARAAKLRFPDLVLERLPGNVGFGTALNLGVRRHPARFLVFVNNDVVCAEDFLARLVEQAETGAQMVAGVLLQRDDPGRIDSAGAAADETLLAFDYLHGEPVDILDGAPPPLGPTGGAALYEVEAFAAVGGFDEHFFAYLEDVDLALRLRRIGARCALAAGARGTHCHSATLGSGSATKNRLMGWGRGYMLRRYGVLRRPTRAARALTVEAAICAGQLLIDRNAAGITGRIDGWRGAAGLAPEGYTSDGLDDLTLLEALSRRARRRPLTARVARPTA